MFLQFNWTGSFKLCSLVSHYFRLLFRFLANEYPESLILKLLQYSTKASLDNEKVRTVFQTTFSFQIFKSIITLDLGMV